MIVARKIVNFSLSHKTALLAFWLACLCFSLWGTTKLTVSSDNRVFYSESNASFKQLKSFENKYLPNHNVSFLLSIPEDENDPSQLIHAVSWLTQEAWEIENVIRVDSIDSYPTAVDTEGEEFTLATIVEVVCESRLVCTNTDYLNAPPTGIDRRLISADRKSLAVSLALELDQSDTTQIERIVGDIGTLEKKFRAAFPEIELNYTGGIPMMHAFSIAADQDSSQLAPFTLLLIFLIASWLIGSVKAGFLLLTAGASCALLTLGLAGHLGHVINPATSIVSILILTLVVTSAMHFVSSYQNDSQLYDSYRAIVNAVNVNLRPIALATITSVAGFLSLTFADAPPVGQLGAMAALGVILGAAHIFFLGPIFVPLLPNKTRPNLSQRIALTASKARMNKTQATFAIGVLVLCGLGSCKLTINDDFVKYFDESFEFRIGTDYVSKHLSGPNHLEVDLSAHENETIFNNAYLQETDKLVHHIREQQGVANVFSIVDVFMEIEPLFDMSQFEASDDELAQFYLAFELSLREGQSTTDYVSNDQESSRVSIILGESDSSSIQKLIEDIEDWSRKNISLGVTVTGENAPVADLTPSNFKSMSAGIAGTLLIAAVLIAITLSSLKLAAICVLCTAAPIAIGFGLWGWIFTEIGLASVVVLAITIGIVIDDAIHIITRYQNIQANEPQYSSAIEQTIRIAGGAIVSSSIALAAGFAVLAFSGFGVNAAMGVCTAIIVLSALCVDLLILPWLLGTNTT